MHETVFDAQFRVAVALMPVLAGRLFISQRRDQVNLHVGQQSIVQLDVRKRAGPAIAVVKLLRREIEFPMMQFHRLGVIRDERRSGICLTGDGQGQNGECCEERGAVGGFHGEAWELSDEWLCVIPEVSVGNQIKTDDDGDRQRDAGHDGADEPTDGDFGPCPWLEREKNHASRMKSATTTTVCVIQ